MTSPADPTSSPSQQGSADTAGGTATAAGETAAAGHGGVFDDAPWGEFGNGGAGSAVLRSLGARLRLLRGPGPLRGPGLLWPLRRFGRPVTALASGLVLYVAFPPIGWWPLAPVAVAGLTLAVSGVRLGRSYRLGLVFGLGFCLPLLRFVTFVGIDGWLVLAAAQAAILAVVAPATTMVLRTAGRWAYGHWLWVAAVWVGQEALRDRVPFGGFPWGRLAFSQADGPFTPLASLGGAPLVTAAVAAVGALIANATIAAYASLPARRTGVPAVRLGLPVAGAAALCLVGFAVPLTTGAQVGVLDVAAVQGDVPDGVPDGGVDALGRPFQVTRNHVAGTEALAADVRAGRTPAPDLVLWPENSSDVDPLVDHRAAVMIDRAAEAVGVPILVGAVLDGPGDGYLRNAGLVWDDGGWTGQMYVKRHPVPFGEYLPGRSVLEQLISRFAEEMPRDFLAGDTPGVIDVAGTTIGDVICFEVAYDGIVRDTVTGGARILVVQTNNASFGRRGESEQQLAMTRLRAVEHGRATVQVSTTGQSAIIAPDGRVLADSGLYEPAVLAAELPLRTSRTLADRVGFWPEAVFVAIGLLAMIAGRRSTRRGQRPASARSARPSRSSSQTGDGDEDATEVQERSRVDGKRVVVCVPTYNERENLGETARRLREANPDVHLLVIDDASPDGTGKIADELAKDDSRVHVLHRTDKAGLGSAYVAGFGWALAEGFDVVVEMDADGSHQPEELPRLLAALDNADLVLGSRWVAGGEVHNWPRSRLVLSVGANAYVRAALGMPLRDATAGFRAYRADVLRDRDLTEVASQGYCFQVDLAWRAWRAGWRVVEVPITFVERERGTSKMSRAIVGEALWRVTWWAVSTPRRRPRVRPAVSAAVSTPPDARTDASTGTATSAAAEATAVPAPAAPAPAAFEQRRPDTPVTSIDSGR